MKNIFLGLLVMIALMGCQNNSTSENEQKETLTQDEQNHMAKVNMEKEVMEIHDAIMPKNSDLKRIERQLNQYLEENATVDQEKKKEIEAMTQKLNQAHKGMMDWMAGYGSTSSKFSEMEQSAVMEALKKEKAKIQKVSDNMERALEEGKTMLQSLGIKE